MLLCGRDSEEEWSFDELGMRGAVAFRYRKGVFGPEVLVVGTLSCEHLKVGTAAVQQRL